MKTNFLKTILILSLASIYFQAYSQCGSVVITEIMYNPDSDESSASATNSVNEWIEIYNPTSTAVSIEGWTFCDDDGCVDPGFPIGTMIAAGGLIVVGDATPSEFSAAWGTAATYLQMESNKSRFK